MQLPSSSLNYLFIQYCVINSTKYQKARKIIFPLFPELSEKRRIDLFFLCQLSPGGL